MSHPCTVPNPCKSLKVCAPPFYKINPISSATKSEPSGNVAQLGLNFRHLAVQCRHILRWDPFTMTLQVTVL